MTTGEKIYIRKKLTELFYCSNIDSAIDSLCECVGFRPFSLGYDVGEEQKAEVEWYINDYFKIKKQEDTIDKAQQDGICIYCNDRPIDVKSANACLRCYKRENRKKKRDIKNQKALIAERFVT